MKFFLLFCLMQTAFFANGQTSIYHPFPDSKASWNIHFNSYCFQNGIGDEFYSITISGDTLIGNQTYHKLVTPFVQSFSTGTCGSILTPYKGAIRQDIVNRKVFFVPPTNNVEQLLYDFTMQVGDTVKGYTETIAQPAADIVKSIDSVLVGSTYRKRWNINSCYHIQFIEGIGSTYGLIERSPGCITDQANFEITCFQQNGQALYPTTTNCQLITLVHSLGKVSDPIKVFPNPSYGSLTVDLGKVDVKQFQLTDLLGNIIRLQKISNEEKIEIKNLKSGTYLLTVIDQHNNATNKIIISYPQ